jgi:amidase
MTVMSWDEWARHDATALAAEVRAGRVTPRELAEQAAEGVARLNPKVNAIIEVFADTLSDPDADHPNRDGALYGVPMFLKDLGSGLIGRTQDSGSGLTRGTVLKATDPTIENFLHAGLVPLGRSSTPEFGLTFDTLTEYDGEVTVTRNPWNLERTSGGSSGGSGVVAATGIVPLSMSSDGGGSTRYPAAFCGLVGLKATRGRVPQPLIRNEYGSRVSIEGVVSRTVRDTAAVWEYLTRVPNGGSFIHMGPPRVSYLDAIRREPGQLRVGLTTGRWGRVPDPDPEVAARVREMAKVLESLGHLIDEVDDGAMCDWSALWSAFTAIWVGATLRFGMIGEEKGLGEQDLERLLNPMTWRHYLKAKQFTVAEVFRMMNDNNTVTRQFGNLMSRYDVLLAPTCAVRVPQANGPYSLLADEELDIWINRLVDAARYTIPANETGLPAISIPAGLDSDGLPIGVQFYGNFTREDLLLRLAVQLEQARPEWFGARPGVHVAA